MLTCICISMHILINVFVFLCNWPDAFLEGAQGKLIPVVVVALPLVSQLTTSHSAKNSILCVILICLKIIIGLEFKGNNSQCRKGHHLLMLKWCFCKFSGYCLLVSQLSTSHSATYDIHEYFIGTCIHALWKASTSSKTFEIKLCFLLSLFGPTKRVNLFNSGKKTV